MGAWETEDQERTGSSGCSRREMIKDGDQVQNMPLCNMPLLYEDYFRLKAIKGKQTEQKPPALPPSPRIPNHRDNSRCLSAQRQH